MDLIEEINNDYKNALRNKDKILVSTLRLLRNCFHNQEIHKKRQKLTEEEVIKVIKSEVKKHNDSIEAFEKGGRKDLVEKEKKELDILSQFIPKQLSKEEIKIFVQRILDKNKDGNLNFGQIMGQVMRELGAKADGKIVSEVVKESIKGRSES